VQSSLVRGLERLHQHVRVPTGDPLNAYLLHFLASQAVAAACLALRDWACVGGRRVCRRLEDTRGPPFAPLDRVAAPLVDTVSFGRDGREGAAERAEIIAKCRRAGTLLSTYGCLLGLSQLLDWGQGLAPCLSLRAVRLRESRLSAEDAAQLLRCAPRLETAVFQGEELCGLAGALQEVSPGSEELRSMSFIDCRLSASDAAAALGLPPRLRTAHFQSMDLRGIRPPRLPSLASLSLLDCHLMRADAVSVMAACDALETLELCGNSLGGDGQPWPPLRQLRRADVRLCGLAPEEEESLRAALPAAASLLCRTDLSHPDQKAQAGAGGGQHTVFDSSDSGEEAS